MSRAYLAATIAAARSTTLPGSPAIRRRVPTTRALVAFVLVALLSLPASAPGWAESAPFPPELAFLAPGQTTEWSVEGQPQIGALRETITQVLASTRAGFPGVSGETVEGFVPGDAYRFAIFSRDLATVLPTARYFYGDGPLRTAIEEFLRLQYTATTRSANGDPDWLMGPGAISATIDRRFTVDKATVTSDEETSLIRAAYVYFQAAGGPEWLRKPINGRPIIERLNDAMAWVLLHRFDQVHGLIMRAHTTDWGDIKSHAVEDPTDIDPEQDLWTASIYDQAIGYAALRELAEMNRAVGRADLGAYYVLQAEQLRMATNAHLWLPERGYYRVHLHLDPTQVHPYDEDAIVAIGNAAALYYGLASPDRAPAIVAALEAARTAAGARKPGLTLQPPYPPIEFRHVQMGPGTYQNGGVWDWWGGRQVTGEFAAGQATLARAHLLAIADDWATHPGEVYEWESARGDLVSADRQYSGAAGAVGEAVLAGLFGVGLSRDGLRLEPRLGEWSGRVRAYQPANGRYAAYEYRFDPERWVITLSYATNAPGDLWVRVLLPPGFGRAGAWRLGRPVPSRLEVTGEDLYLAFGAPAGGPHTIVIPVAPPE